VATAGEGYLMPRRPDPVPRERAWIREAAVAGILLGLVFLIAPVLVSDPLLHAALEVLRLPGEVALAAGALLLWLRILGERWSVPGAPVVADDAPAAADAMSVSPIELNTAAWIRAHGAAPSAADLDNVAANAAQTADRQGLEALESDRFIALCVALFEQAGLQACIQPDAAPGRAEIWLHSRHAPGPPIRIVHCRAGGSGPVEQGELVALWHVMTACQVSRGIFAASSRFTLEAQRFARDHRIQLLEPGGLLELIRSRAPDQQRALWAAAAALTPGSNSPPE